MTQRWFVPILLLLAALLACGQPAPINGQTAVAQTQVTQASMTAGAGQTLAAVAATKNAQLGATKQPTSRSKPTDNGQPTDSGQPSDTPPPARTPKPAKSPTPVPSDTPAASPTPTKRPTRLPPAGPTLLEVVVAVKKQIENFGGQIDIGVSSGTIDCQQTVDSYEFAAARATLNNVPNSQAGAYQLYLQGVALFLSKGADLYTNCKNFLADPNGGGSVPALQWTVARTAVNDAGDLLRQAIIALGGTP